MKRVVTVSVFLLMLGRLFGSGEEKVFTIGFSEMNLKWNPLFTIMSGEAQIYSSLFEGLVYYHPRTLEPIPGQASEWEVEEDGTRYRFKLRENLVYSNGDPIKAEHFRESWLYLLKRETKADFATLLSLVKGVEGYQQGTLSADEVGVTVDEAGDLIVELEYPSPHLLKILSLHTFSPIHPSLLEKRDWSGEEEIIGNGAYRVASKRDGEVLLEKNPYYWDRQGTAIESLKLFFSDDTELTTELFNRGEIDWVTGSVSYNDLYQREIINTGALFATQYYFFKSSKEPWSNPKVTKALALLLPLKEIRSNYLIPTERLIPSIPGYPKSKILGESNKKRAMELLFEAGYPKGVGLPNLVIKVPVASEASTVLETFKEVWEESLNISVEVVATSWSDYFGSLRDDDYTVGTVSWVGDYADPLAFLQMWTTESSLNDAGYSNSRYDTLLQESMLAEDERTRLQKLSEAESILLESAQVIPITHFPSINIIDTRLIGGWYPNALDNHSFKELYKKSNYMVPGTY